MNKDDIDSIIKKNYRDMEERYQLFCQNELRIEQEKLDVIFLSDICDMLDKEIMIQQ